MKSFIEDDDEHNGKAKNVGRKKNLKKKPQQKDNLLYEDFFKNFQGLISIIDLKGNYVYLSNTWENIIGYANSEMIGQPFMDYVYPDDFQNTLDIYPYLRTNKNILGFRNRIRCKGGSYRWIEWHSFLSGEFIYSISHDITDRENTERDLIAEKHAAQEGEKQKTAMLQNISHDMKTPLNAIIGFSDLILSHIEDQDKLIKYTSVIRQSSVDLLHLINDVLDISRIEKGQLQANLTICNLPQLFQEICDFFINHKKKIGKDHLEISVNHICDKLYKSVYMDCVKVKQIFFNLIYNALKFTNKGFIVFGCSRISNSHVEFYVSDTGVGIPEEKKDLIFERFRKIENNNQTECLGSGLGLSIVKGLIDLLQGEIRLKSIVGQGSTFFFQIPYKPALSRQTKAMEDSELKPVVKWDQYRILIVEDDEFGMRYLMEILSKTGAILETVQTAEEALERISSGKSFDVVIMDIRLKGMNGYEATRIIKKIKPETAVIAQSAYSTQECIKKALDSGCDDYIIKPFNKKTLLAKLEMLLCRIVPR